MDFCKAVKSIKILKKNQFSYRNLRNICIQEKFLSELESARVTREELFC